MNRRKFMGVGLAAFAVMMAPTTDLEAVDFRATKPAAWEAEKTADGIVALYGRKGTGGAVKAAGIAKGGSTSGKKIDSDAKNFSFKAPKLAENGGSIPITIKSKLDLESVAFFQDANPRCLSTVFTIPVGAIIEYDFRIKMRQTAPVMIVGKIRGKDEYHFSRKEIDVSIGGCGG
jgi:sulfur-oxidizing protein SoxY